MARARGAYRMTAKRRAALKKAQIASARKRKGRGKRRAAIAAGVSVGVVLGAGVYRHKASGSSIKVMSSKSIRTGEFKTTTTYKPIQFDERGFRTGGGSVTKREVIGNKLFKAGVTRTPGPGGTTYGIVAGPAKIVYNHRTLAKARGTVTGTPVNGRRVVRVNRGGIPKYNPDSKRNWPNNWRPMDDEKYQPTTRWEEAMLGKKMRAR